MTRGSSLWLGLPVRFCKRARSQVMASSLPPSPLEQAGAVQLASPFSLSVSTPDNSLSAFTHLFTNQHLLSIALYQTPDGHDLIQPSQRPRWGNGPENQNLRLVQCPTADPEFDSKAHSLFTAMLPPFIVWGGT